MFFKMYIYHKMRPVEMGRIFVSKTERAAPFSIFEEKRKKGIDKGVLV